MNNRMNPERLNTESAMLFLMAEIKEFEEKTRVNLRLQYGTVVELYDYLDELHDMYLNLKKKYHNALHEGES